MSPKICAKSFGTFEKQAPGPDRTADSLVIIQITAAVTDCKCDLGANTNVTNNMASDSRSDIESQGQNNIVESLIQAYIPNTKTSQANKGKTATVIDNMLSDGEADAVKERAYKYSPAENIKPLNCQRRGVGGTSFRRTQTVDLTFQRVQLLLPSLSALCSLSVQLISSIQSGGTLNIREILLQLSWIASLFHAIRTTCWTGRDGI